MSSDESRETNRWLQIPTLPEVNPFTPQAFWDNQTGMRHVVTIGSPQHMTRLGGPVEDVAH
jgi:hypothetical protein